MFIPGAANTVPLGEAVSIMFVFFAFLIHHVYSAVLVSWEERNGLIKSIFTG